MSNALSLPFDGFNLNGFSFNLLAQASPGSGAALPAPSGAGPEWTFLLSFGKPLLMLLVFFGWAWVATLFDKDAGYYYLKRYTFNTVQLVAGVVALLAMLLVPIFWIGLPVAILILLGGLYAYVQYRNGQVPANEAWSLSPDRIGAMLQERREGKKQDAAKIKLLSQDEGILPVPSDPSDPNTAAHEYFEEAMIWALEHRAEFIELMIDKKKAVMVVRVDGVKYKRPDVNVDEAVAILDYLKTIAELDVKDRRKRQTARIKFEAGDLGMHDAELITAGSTRGVSLTLTIDPAGMTNMPPEHLGMLKDQREQIDKLREQPGGIVLISGPPGSGISTTMYSFLSAHDPYMSSVNTIENEVRFELEGVNHFEMPNASPEEFNQKLSAMLRGEPDAVLLDHIPDPESAKLIAEAAETTRFYIPVRANSSFEAIKKWAKTLNDPKLAAKSLAGVTNQRLHRRLCHTCRIPFKPDAAALKKMNIPAAKVDQLYKAGGQVMVKDKPEECEDCMGLAYKGRAAVFEIFAIEKNTPAPQHIAKLDFDGLKTYFRKQKAMMIQEAAIQKVVDGIVDIKEVQRALADKS